MTVSRPVAGDAAAAAVAGAAARPPVFDSHTHLDIAGDRPASRRGRSAGTPRRGRASTPRWSRSATTLRVVALVRGRGGRRTRTCYAAVAIHPNEVGGADRRRRAGRDRPAGRAAAGAGGGRDRARLLPGPGAEPTAAAGALPRAHRDRQARRQGAGDPRPGRARRRAARSCARRAPPEQVVFHCFSGDAAMAAVRARARATCCRFAGNADLQERAGSCARPPRSTPAGPAAGRDRRAVPHPDAAPRPAQRALPGPAHGARPGGGQECPHRTVVRAHHPYGPTGVRDLVIEAPRRVTRLGRQPDGDYCPVLIWTATVSERGRHRHRAHTEKPTAVGDPQWTARSSDRPQWTPPESGPPESWFEEQAGGAEGRWRPVSDLTDTSGAPTAPGTTRTRPGTSRPARAVTAVRPGARTGRPGARTRAGTRRRPGAPATPAPAGPRPHPRRAAMRSSREQLGRQARPRGPACQRSHAGWGREAAWDAGPRTFEAAWNAAGELHRLGLAELRARRCRRPAGAPRAGSGRGPRRPARVRHPLRLGLFALVLIGLVAGSAAWLSMDKSVRLTVDGQARSITTYASTVGGVLDDQKIAVGEHDTLAPGRETRISDGAEIVLRRGRLVTLTVDGTQRQVWTTATTVQEALEQVGYRQDGLCVSANRSTRLPLAGYQLTLRTPKNGHDRRGRQEALDHDDRPDRRRGAGAGRGHRRRRRPGLPAGRRGRPARDDDHRHPRRRPGRPPPGPSSSTRRSRRPTRRPRPTPGPCRPRASPGCRRSPGS